MKHFLIRCAGVSAEELEGCDPSERRWYPVLGAVALGTAGVAFVSGAYALQVRGGIPLPAAVVLSAAWSVAFLVFGRDGIGFGIHPSTDPDTTRPESPDPAPTGSTNHEELLDPLLGGEHRDP
jgi:hypothetical protein